MTQKEFETQDQEAMDLANRVPKTCEEDRSVTAEDLQRGGVQKIKVDPHACCENPEAKYARMARRARELLWACLKACACVAITVALLLALLWPEHLVHLVNVGVLCCSVTAGIQIDRAIRKR